MKLIDRYLHWLRELDPALETEGSYTNAPIPVDREATTPRAVRSESSSTTVGWRWR
jgi:hypothetical protein